MNPHLQAFLETVCLLCAWELVLGMLCQMVARVSTRIADFCARAPVLDLLLAALTWLPWVFACAFAGWIGLAGAVLGQMVALYVWCFQHELLHREAARGPRIVKFLNRTVGRWRNHLALWLTLIALPGFWIIRIMQIAAYWPLVVLLRFPSYRSADWINVSRQKFSGLIGHDLVWCLYCDWMTGVYSLGAEMLRNVESFWCPIRFYEGKKCDNCRIDFPDIEHGWVAAGATMGEVVATLEQHYGDGRREWYGHPARLTVNGKPIEAATVA